MAAPKKATSFTISERANELLDRLAKHLGISRTSVIEMIIREEAEKKLGVR